MAVNPQTNLMEYKKNAVARYINQAWNDRLSVSELSNLRTIDLRVIYSVKMENHIVVIQNSADHRHLYSQASSFLLSIREADYKKVNVEIGFWGKVGHSGSVPPAAFLPWIKALLKADDYDSDQLLLERHSYRADDVLKESGRPRTASHTERAPIPSAGDVKISRRILASASGMELYE